MKITYVINRIRFSEIVSLRSLEEFFHKKMSKRFQNIILNHKCVKFHSGKLNFEHLNYMTDNKNMKRDIRIKYFPLLIILF